jgi:carbamate kinase
MERQGIAVVAVGGNALIKDKAHQTVQDQFNAANDTMQHIVDMIQKGWDVVVTHGNGPQVGFILRRSELASHELHEIPLDYCGADTQGAIGYMFQNSLHNEFKRRGMEKDVATVVTQTIVDRNDPAFQNPLSQSVPSWMKKKPNDAPIMRVGRLLKMQAVAIVVWCLHRSRPVLSKRK